jgi:hypothetical protein
MNAKSSVLLVLLSLTACLLRAEPPVVSQTNGNVLNDLLREIPFLATSWDRQIRRLSSVQEQLHLHELRMRGEGLPAEMAALFSENYSSILTALVQDRITEEYGRELLSVHRQLIDHTRSWLGKRVRDEGYPEQLRANVAYFRSELDRYTIPLEDVPAQLRTPVINGYQIWAGELLYWAENSGELASGEVSRLRTKLDALERFERFYKEDGVLAPNERELLHGRFVKLTQDTIQTVLR